MSGTRRYMMAGGGMAGGGMTFFGHYAMFREFWAEDPNWTTKPADGGNLTTWNDNGTANADISVFGSAGYCKYRASHASLNNRPTVDFVAANRTVGESLSTASGTTGAVYTVGMVVEHAYFTTTIAYLTDFNASGDRQIIGWGATSQVAWNGYGNAGMNVDAGPVTPGSYFIVCVFKSNDLRLYENTTLLATDSSGTITGSTGFCLGGSENASSTHSNSAIPYAFVYDGDLTADAGFPAWRDAIMNYYGIT